MEGVCKSECLLRRRAELDGDEYGPSFLHMLDKEGLRNPRF
jgi:hypothetical protein